MLSIGMRVVPRVPWPGNRPMDQRSIRHGTCCGSGSVVAGRAHKARRINLAVQQSAGCSDCVHDAERNLTVGINYSRAQECSARSGSPPSHELEASLGRDFRGTAEW